MRMRLLLSVIPMRKRSRRRFTEKDLDGLMRCPFQMTSRGIVNGIDYDEYNPETDAYIAKNYNVKNFRKEKVKNKTGSAARAGS